MSENDDHGAAPSPDWPVVDFLLRLRSDQAAGQVRQLGDYLREFPAHQEAVAREFLLIRSLDGAAASADEVPTFGRFRLGRELGRGGQGVVHLAHDVESARAVALKLLHRSPDGELAGARLQREVELLRAVAQDGLAAVLASGCTDGRHWIATEYVAGESLSARLERDRRAGVCMSVREAAAFGAALARTLHRAHGLGIVHRDVKPGNVMLRDDGTPVLTDFGLARARGSEQATLTHSGELRGTPAYMAPEQLAGGAVDARADVWALGAILFECLSGERPFAAPTVAATAQAVARREVWSLPGYLRLDADVRAVVAVAMAKAPARRYATAADLARDCERLAAGQRPAARRPGPLRRLAAFARNEPALAAVSLTAVVLLGAGLSSSQWFLARERELAVALQAREQRVRSVARSLLFELHAAVRDLPGAVDLRQRMLERARDALQELHEASPADQGLRQDLVAAWIQLGDVLGHGGVANRGERDLAQRSYLAAAALVEADAAAGEPGARVALATTQVRLGDLAMDREGAAREHYRRALELLTEGDALQRGLRATALCCLAQFDREAGELDRALARCRESERLFAVDVAAVGGRDVELVGVRLVHATVMAAQGELTAARQWLDEIAAEVDRLRAAAPDRVQLLARAAQCAIYQGNVAAAAGDLVTALAAAERAVQLRRERRAGDHDDRGAVHELALGLVARANALAAVADPDLDRIAADLTEAADLAAAAGFAEFAAQLRRDRDAFVR